MIAVYLISLFLLLVIATGIVLLISAGKRAREGNPERISYRAVYNLGRLIVILSIVIMIGFFVLQIPFYAALPLIALGILYLVVGRANRAKW